LAGNIRKKLDACVFSFGHLALRLSLHYLVKCNGHSLAIDINEFLPGSKCIQNTRANAGRLLDRVNTV